jgi:hypothetical protein
MSIPSENSSQCPRVGWQDAQRIQAAHECAYQHQFVPPRPERLQKHDPNDQVELLFHNEGPVRRNWLPGVKIGLHDEHVSHDVAQAVVGVREPNADEQGKRKARPVADIDAPESAREKHASGRRDRGEPVRRGVDTVPGDDEEDLNADLATADHRLQGVPEAFWPRTVEQHNCQAGDAAGGIQ